MKSFDSDLYNLDVHFAKIIHECLVRFKATAAGHPAELTVEEWDAILDEMIETFRYISSDEYWDAEQEDYQRVADGLQLFAKWYMNLWI